MRILAFAAVLLGASVAQADNFFVFSRGQLWQGSYNNSGGYMIGPHLQVTQWMGRPPALPVPQVYTPPGFYTPRYYYPQPVYRFGF